MFSTRRLAWLGLIVLLVAIVTVPYQAFIWDGAFPSVECRFRFVDGNAKPVSGVTLNVRTRAGGDCPFYPVDEYGPNTPLISSQDGWIVFHHTGHSLEYGGRESKNLLGMLFGDTESPHYDCIFILRDREVFRCHFHFRSSGWKAYRKASVIRELGPRWDASTLGLLPGEDWDMWRMRTFDGNKDGSLDREERTAAGNALRKLERTDQIVEHQFEVFERTITIP